MIDPIPLPDDPAAQRALYGALLANHIALLVSSDGTIRFANQPLAALVGQTPAQLVGRTLWELAHADDHDRLRQALASPGTAHVDGALPEMLAWRLRTPDDDWHQLEGQLRHVVSAESANRTAAFIGHNVTPARVVEARLAEQARQLAVLHDIALALNAESDLDTLLHSIVVRAVSLLNCRIGGLYLVAPRGDHLVLTVAHNLADTQPGTILPRGDGVAGRVLASGEPLMVADYSAWDGRAAIFRDVPIRRVVAVPLTARGQVLGVINVADDRRTGAFSAEELRLVTLFAQQAAQAVHKMRLLADSHRRNRELEGLYETALVTARLQEPADLFHQLHDRVLELIPSDIVMVGAYDAAQAAVTIVHVTENGQTLADWEGRRLTPSDRGLINWVVHSRKPLLIYDMARDPLPVEPIHTARPAASWLCVPLLAYGEVVGVISVQSFQAGQFDDAHMRLLQLLAAQVAVALESAQRFAETRRRADELGRLADMSRALRSAQTLDDVLAVVLEEGVSVIDGAVGAVFIANGGGQIAQIVASYPPGAIAVGAAQPVGQGITGHVLRTGDTLTTHDLHHDPRFVLLPQEEDALRDVHSVAVVPLWGDDEVIGALHLGSRRREPFSAGALRLLNAMADIAGSAIQRALVLETLEQRVAQRNFELQQKNRELELANERLTELDHIKSRFVSDISHELRTPITSILLYLDLLERGRPEKRGQYLATLKREAGRLKHLVAEVLKLSRWDLQRVQVAFALVDLNQVAQGELLVQQPRADEAGLALTLDADPALPAVWGEPTQLGELVGYLLDNAVSYTTTGHVRVRTFADADMVYLEVADSGIGIPADDLPRIFERMFRGENVAAVSTGTGLGLTIVEQIVKLHGGTIAVDSKLGVGTTVTVGLPLGHRPNPAASPPT